MRHSVLSALLSTPCFITPEKLPVAGPGCTGFTAFRHAAQWTSMTSYRLETQYRQAVEDCRRTPAIDMQGLGEEMSPTWSVPMVYVADNAPCQAGAEARGTVAHHIRHPARPLSPPLTWRGCLQLITTTSCKGVALAATANAQARSN